MPRPAQLPAWSTQDRCFQWACGRVWSGPPVSASRCLPTAGPSAMSCTRRPSGEMCSSPRRAGRTWCCRWGARWSQGDQVLCRAGTSGQPVRWPSSAHMPPQGNQMSVTFLESAYPAPGHVHRGQLQLVEVSAVRPGPWHEPGRARKAVGGKGSESRAAPSSPHWCCHTAFPAARWVTCVAASWLVNPQWAGGSPCEPPDCLGPLLSQLVVLPFRRSGVSLLVSAPCPAWEQ